MHIYEFVTSVLASSSRSHEVLYHNSSRLPFSALSQCFGPLLFPTACTGVSVGQAVGLCAGGCMSFPPGERETSWQHHHAYEMTEVSSAPVGGTTQQGLLQSARSCRYPYPGYGQTEQLSSPCTCARLWVPILRKERQQWIKSKHIKSMYFYETTTTGQLYGDWVSGVPGGTFSLHCASGRGLPTHG